MKVKDAHNAARAMGLLGAPILNANDPNFADQLRREIGAEPGDTIEIVTPQFRREPGAVAPHPPPEPFEAIRDRTLPELRSLGCRAWNDPKNPDPDNVRCFGEGGMLMLFPGEWYYTIPNGFEIVGISGRRESFVRGETDDDIRFGCLAYGVIVAGGGK